MRKVLLGVMAVLFTVNCLFAKDSDAEMNVMSYNLRYDNPGDGVNEWKNRKDYAASLIRFYDVDLFGSQEVLNHQLTDLLDRLPEFAYVGVGREDGKTKGEYAPIFYRKDRFTLVKSGNFWLGEDMNAVGKKGWDAACERVATWAILMDKQTSKKFFMLNTHLDHMGKVARHEGAALVLSEAKNLSEGLPIIVTGDFNATPDDEPIQVLTGASDPRHLVHARDLAPYTYGPEWTFHNYGKIPYANRSWIDYIFVKGDFKVLNYGVLAESLNEVYPSDHCPVMTRLVIR